MEWYNWLGLMIVVLILVVVFALSIWYCRGESARLTRFRDELAKAEKRDHLERYR